MNELRQRAIRWLARRDYSRLELARKLAAHGTSEEIEAMLAQLESDGMLSDRRSAEAYIRGYGLRHGSSRLRRALLEKGISGELSAELLNGLPDELERARHVWMRKFPVAPADPREWARQARFLQSRGFSTDVIRRILKERAE